MLKQIAIVGGGLIAAGAVGIGVMAATGHTTGIPLSFNQTSGISFVGDGLTGHSVHKQQQIDAATAKSVSINANIAAIRLVPADSNQASISLNGTTTIPDSQLKLTSKMTGANLRITLTDRNEGDIGSNVNLKLDVSVPQYVYDSLNVHANVGSVSVEKVNSKQMTIHVNTGKIDVKDLQSSVTATSNVGAVAVTNVAGPLRLTTNTGSVKVQENALKNNIDASTNTGSVSISSTESPKDLSFDLTTSLGDVQVGLPGVEYAQQSKRHLQGSIGQGGPTIHASSNLGSVKLQ